MSGGRIEIEAKKIGEIVTVPFDFTGKSGPLEEIDSASVTVSVFSGVDASPSAIRSGTAEVVGLIVYQQFTGGVAGTVYLAVCRANFSDGSRAEISAYIGIESP